MTNFLAGTNQEPVTVVDTLADLYAAFAGRNNSPGGGMKPGIYRTGLLKITFDGTNLTGEGSYLTYAAMLADSTNLVNGVSILPVGTYFAVDTNQQYSWNGLMLIPTTGIKVVNLLPGPGNATVNIGLINNALSTKGTVGIFASGSYQYNGTLLLPSDTKLIVGSGVALTQASGANSSFLTNVNAASAEINSTSAITVANPTGGIPGYKIATLPVASLPVGSSGAIAPGGYIQIRNDNTGQFNGIWRVALVDSTHIYFYVPGQSLWTVSSSGIVVSVADANISIQIDGIIDGNQSQNTAMGMNGCGFVLNRISALRFKGGNLYNFPDYALLMANQYGALVKELNFDTNKDGIHAYGNMFNCGFSELFGKTGDDFAAFGGCYSDVTSGLIPINGFGPISGITIEGVQIQSSNDRGVCFYPSALYGGVSDVTVRSIVAPLMNTSICEIGSAAGDLGTANNITLDGIVGGGNPSGNTNFAVNLTGSSGGSVTIKNINTGTFGDAGTSRINAVGVSNNVTLDVINIEDCEINFDTSIAGGFSLIRANGSGIAIDTVNLVNCRTTSSGATTSSYSWVYANGSAGMIANVNVKGGSLKGFGNIYNPVTQGGVSSFNVEGNHNFNGQYLFGDAETTKINVNGINITGCSSYVFHNWGTSASYNITVANLRNPAAASLFSYGITNTINFNNPDGSCPVDLSKIARTAGAIAKSVAGNGTIVAGNLAICDATGAANSWKQLSNTSLVY